MTDRRLAEVVADVVAASSLDPSATAVLERLGAAIREVLPGARAEVQLDGLADPIAVVTVPGGERTAAEAVEAPLRVADDHFGTLKVFACGGGELGSGGGDGAAQLVVSSLADVTAACLRVARTNEELRTSLELSRQDALHDPLTGLPNRALLVDRLDTALARGRRTGRVAAVIFLDLDRFKRINDTYGHGAGDALLTAFADRLTGALRPSDTAARLSGDEFVVLCEDLSDAGQVAAIGRRLMSLCADPFVAAGHEITVSASVGVAAATPHHTATAILDDADAAMYEAKKRGGHQVQVIDLRAPGETRDLTSTRSASGARGRGALLSIVEPEGGEFRRALGAHGLQCLYRPVVGTVSGDVAWAQMSVWWDHPSTGRLEGVDLSRFVGRYGLSVDMVRAVVELACADQAGWVETNGQAGVAPGVEVGISTAQLFDPGFVDVVSAALEGAGTNPSALTLAVDADVVTTFADRAGAVLAHLAAVGVTLALGDFDASRSALGTLHHHHLDVVRIRARTDGEMEDPANHALVFATTEAAHLLGMAVVADGVSTPAQREQATILGCDYSQGPLFGLGVPAPGIHA